LTLQPRNGFEIRRIGAVDLDLALEWREMLNRVFGETPGPAPSRSYMADLLSDPNFIPLAALQDRAVIGGIAAYELRKYEAERSEIYLYDLAVDERHRRRGVATALIERLREHAAECGAWMIFVQADKRDEAAIALYKGLGSREDVLHFDIEPARRV
jgi:aminoglycoside 3-N-acetyltransferase I